MNEINSENLIDFLQKIYSQLMIDADDVGMAYDEILQYVENFDMNEDMLFDFIKDKVDQNKQNKKGREVMESLKRSLRNRF
jgi:UV DNA damage repair endonuclease